MTAIVFHQGKLMGDRKNALFTNPVTFVDAPKVFVVVLNHSSLKGISDACHLS